jgi:hypothetical protein
VTQQPAPPFNEGYSDWGGRGANCTKGKTVILDKILFGNLRVEQHWKTKYDISEKILAA